MEETNSGLRDMRKTQYEFDSRQIQTPITLTIEKPVQ